MRKMTGFEKKLMMENGQHLGRDEEDQVRVGGAESELHEGKDTGETKTTEI